MTLRKQLFFNHSECHVKENNVIILCVFEEETSKMLHLEHDFAETWRLRAADQKYLESFEM